MRAYNKKKKPKHTAFSKSIYYKGWWCYCPYCKGVMKTEYSYIEEYPYPSQWGYKCTCCGALLDYFEAREEPYTLYKNINGKLKYDAKGTKKFLEMCE